VIDFLVKYAGRVFLPAQISADSECA
jgi:hypothetical protein